MEFLFQYIPAESQITKLVQFYIASKNGYMLKSLYANAKKYEDSKGMIFCIKSHTGCVFGGFCNQVFQLTQIYYLGNEDSFVFSILPNREVFKAGNENNFYLLCDTTYFAYGGGGEGEAIRLNEDLESGSTNRSATFANKRLTGEGKDPAFQCAEFEAYALI